MSASTRLKLKIAGLDFSLKAQERDIERLQQVAQEVDQRIQELQNSGLGSAQRAAVMAAFQYAYESFGIKDMPNIDAEGCADLRERVDSMIAQIDEVLQ